MNILLINHYAGSERMGMEYRPFYLGREWVAAGHRVTVVAASWSHLRGVQPSVRADLETTEEEGVRFRWIGANEYAGNGTRRVANMMSFAGKLWLHADRLAREERPDLVVCSSTYPLDIHAGSRIARRSGARLVFEVHDLWPLTPMLLGGYSPRHPYIRLLQHAEDKAYREADAVVSLLPAALSYMASRGLDPEKFVHVPNGVPLSRSTETCAALPGHLAQAIAHHRVRGRFLVGFAGGLTLSTMPETLLEAARILTTEEIAFVLAGDGPSAPTVREGAAALALDNFTMLGRLPKAAVAPFLAGMDALAVCWRRSPLYRYGVSPNKLFDYMAAGKPVLQASDAANDLVAQARCGLTVPPEDPLAFAEAVRRLRALPEVERRRLGTNGQHFVAEHHDYRVLAAAFLEGVARAAVHFRPTAATAPAR